MSYAILLQAILFCCVARSAEQEALIQPDMNSYVIDIRLHEPHMQEILQKISDALPDLPGAMNQIILGCLIRAEEADKKRSNSILTASYNHRIAQCISGIGLLGSMAEATYGLIDIITNQHVPTCDFNIKKNVGLYGFGLGFSVVGTMITCISYGISADDMRSRFRNVHKRISQSELMIALACSPVVVDIFTPSISNISGQVISDITSYPVSSMWPAVVLLVGGSIGTVAAANVLFKSCYNRRKVVQLSKKVV